MMELEIYRQVVAQSDLKPEDKHAALSGINLQTWAIRQLIAKSRCERSLSLLGLERCADTIVGNVNIRGVSGGER